MLVWDLAFFHGLRRRTGMDDLPVTTTLIFIRIIILKEKKSYYNS
jgi:hypothetical protein